MPRSAANIRADAKRSRTLDKFSDTDKHAGLTLAAQVGITEASRELKVGRKVLYRWVDQFPELWSDLQRARSARLDDLVDRYAAAEDAAIDRAMEILQPTNRAAEPLDARETAALIKAMGSSRQAATVGARSVRGDPDQTAQLSVNFPALERAAEALLAKAERPAIEGTAEDLD